MEGMKYDQEKPLYNLLPMKAVDDVVKVLTYGAKKYAPNNWRKVENGHDRYLAAAMRHISSHMQGEEIDPESGLSHLSHATCSLMFMMALPKFQVGCTILDRITLETQRKHKGSPLRVPYNKK